MLSNVETIAALFGLSDDFYGDVLKSLLERGVLRRDMRILVACGGVQDRDVLQRCGFSNVTISNVDTRTTAQDMAPFTWSFQDVERLTFSDGEFDFVIVHNGLHHCHSPHRAACEMYRVSRIGLLAFEPYENLLSRAAVKFGLGQEYEAAAVFDSEMSFGGVANTEIPNHVYRWTEREVHKLIKSYCPVGRHRVEFFYTTRIPWTPLRRMKRKMALIAALVMLPAIGIARLAFRKACNNFAFCVVKPKLPDDLQPWLNWDGHAVRLDRDWMTRRYSKGLPPESCFQ